MLDYNTLVELVERIHKNIGVGSTVVLKGETSDIKNLSKSIINKLKCGDIVVKKTDNQKHAYIVTYKEEKQGICLTYIDADCIETVSYDYTNGNWVYNSTDVTSIPVLKAKQDALVSGENIKTVNGNSLLGEGNIEISAGKLYRHIIYVYWYSITGRSGGAYISFINNVKDAYTYWPAVCAYLSNSDSGTHRYKGVTVNGYANITIDNVTTHLSFASIASVSYNPSQNIAQINMRTISDDSSAVFSDAYSFNGSTSRFTDSVEEIL